MRISHLTLGALLLASAVVSACDSSDSISVPTISSVRLTLAADTLEIRQSNTSRAVAIGATGDTLSFVPTFSSSAPEVVGINPFTGDMLALSAGTADIIAAFGLNTAKKTVTVVAPAIRINEVKPNGEGPGGWVELVNPTDAPVSAAGWIITSTNRASAFIIPAGVMIAPHGFLTIEEADFPEGLTSADEVHLYNRFGAQSDEFSWVVNPATSFGRCSDGTGPFVTNVAPSKTRANACP